MRRTASVHARGPVRRRAAALLASGAAVALALAALATPAGAALPPSDGTPVGGAELATTRVAVHPAAGIPPLPAVPAAGWLVADLDTGEILAAQDPHGRYAPASTLKILTALVLIPRIPANRTITATSEQVAVDGTRTGVVPGHTYTADMLFHGLLMDSGNDTARVLAGAAGGDAAVETLMNDEAAHLQARDTVARSVSGLDAAGQTTSAYDLALISRAALGLPAFRSYVATERYAFAGTGIAPFQISNHNPLLGVYPGTYGVKNGYTEAARASYVGSAARGGRHLVVTMIKADPEFRKPAEALLDWGFAADGNVTPVGVLVDPEVPLSADRAPVPTLARAAAGRTEAAGLPGRHGSGLGLAAYAGFGAGAAVVVLFFARRTQLARRRRRRYASRLRLPPL